MRSPFRSIRAKLTIWYSSVVLMTLIAFGLISYAYLSEQLADNLDRSLRNEVKWVNNFIMPKAAKVKPSRKFSQRKKVSVSVVGPQQKDEPPADLSDPDDEIWNQIYEHALLNPRKTIIEVTDKKGAVIFKTMSALEESLMIGNVTVDSIKMITLRSSAAGNLRIAATATQYLNIYAAYPVSDLRDVLGNLFSVFLILIPVTVAISVAGGWFLAWKTLQPVDLITKTARRITAENLDQQIPKGEVDDELGRLISTINDMIGRLRHSFDRVKQFSIDASHELKTPLTIMRGETELALASAKDPDEYRRVLVSNLEENLRLAAIIDNLLTLSKADLGQIELSLVPMNLRQLVEELHEDSEIIAMKKQIRIEFEADDDIFIRGDKIRLRQLFLNLIENAIKFTPEGGTVTLSVKRQGQNAAVSVSDTGIGIPKEEQGKIFDRFYRIDKGRSRELGGSGLGLSIAKWVAEMHKGQISVESEPMEGSTFTVLLPVAAGAVYAQISAPTER